MLLSNTPTSRLALVAAISLGLLLLDLLLYFSSAQWALLDITLEANLPTLYSSALALLAGWLAWRNGSLGGGRGWYLVGAFFCFLGIDDLFTLHERLGTYAGGLAEAGREGWLFEWLRSFRSYYWHVVAAPFFVAAGLLMLLFLRRGFDERAALWAFIAGLGCYALAMLMDLLDGDVENYRWLMEHTPLDFADARHLLRAIEECVEMQGTGLILYAFLRQRRLYAGG